MEADQRLTAVADPLKQQQDDAVHIRHHRIGRNGGVAAVGHRAAVDEQQHDIRRHGQAKRRQAGGQDLSDKAVAQAEVPAFEKACFAQYKQDAGQCGDRLADDGGQCRAGYAELKPGYKPGVEHDVGHKAAHHREHRQQRRLVIAQHGGEAGGQDLEGRAENNDTDVIRGGFQNVALCPEQTQQRTIAKQQPAENEQAGDQQQDQGVAQQGTLFFCVVPAAGDRERNGAAHADAGAHRLDQRGERVSDIDGGKTDVPGAAPDEKAVDDRVKPRKGKRQHGRKDIAPEFFEHSYLHGSERSAQSRIRVRLTHYRN